MRFPETKMKSGATTGVGGIRVSTIMIVVACLIAAGGCGPIDSTAGSSLLPVPVRAGSGCSALSVTVDGRGIFGANLDYRLHTRGQLYINKRGVHKTGTIPNMGGAYAEWVSRYASLTFNFVGYQYPWGGMNEKGLVMSTMALPQTVYPPPDDRPVVDSGFWMQYILDTCETVDDVIAADDLVRNITVDHYLVTDRSGASAVIEYIDGELVVHTGGNLPVSVLTNWFYDDSLLWWRAYRDSGNYSSMDGSLQRFCIAADRLSSFEATTAEEGIAYAFDTLDAIAGERFTNHASQWSMVFDTRALRVYFKTLAHRDLRYVDLGEFSRWCEDPVQMLDIDAPLAGDASPWFTGYSHSEARDHLHWFVDFWETDATSAWADQMLHHFEGFSCEPRPRHRRQSGRRVAPAGVLQSQIDRYRNDGSSFNE